MKERRPIIVAGGGIGGLAAAIALADKGWPVQVIERASEFREIGAGIQLGPNGARMLEALGVAPLLAPSAIRLTEIAVYDGLSGSHLASLPLGASAEERYGAPYWAVHRADLHGALLRRCEDIDGVRLRTGVALARLQSTPDGVIVGTETGKNLQGAGLVLADGVWSTGRCQLFPRTEARFLGKTASRALLAAPDAPPSMIEPRVGLWLLPHAHVVHYPVKAGSQLNIVVILKDDWMEQRWDGSGEQVFIEERLASAAPALRELVAIPGQWGRWPLYELDPLKRWSNGLVTLLGDAAHPVLPFLAQGASLALEDAVTLADSLARQGHVLAAWQSYGNQRRPRTARLQATSKRNGRIYHLSGPSRLARNLAMRNLPAARLLAQYDWIYEFGR